MIKTPRGLALVELLVAISVVAVSGILLLYILVNNSSFSYRESTRVNLGIGVNTALSRIRHSIRVAGSVASAYPESGSALFSSNTSSLVLKILSTDSTGNIVPNTYDYQIFVKDQDRLKMYIYPDLLSNRVLVDQVVIKEVDNLTFHYLDSSGLEVSPPLANKVKVTITLKQKAGLRYETSIATTEANLRND